MNTFRFPCINLVYNRYRKASPAKDAVIEICIAYQRKQKWMSTGIRVFPKEWQRGRITNRLDAIPLNKTLDLMLAEVHQEIYEMLAEGDLDIFAIPARLEKKRNEKVPFLEFCQERAKIRKYGKAEDSQERYNRFLRFLGEYGKIKRFSDLNERTVMELDKYLVSKGMVAKSRWCNYHRFLNSFILDARKEGLLQVNPYDRVKIEKGNDKEGIHRRLTPDEFHAIEQLQLDSERLARVRDLFVFQTYTCLSYTDLASFDPAKIKDVKGSKVYVGYRGKTKQKFTIPLLKPALDILERYKDKLPILSNVRYNDYLKEVMQAAGIGKPVSTHWARHTGATLLLNSGVPLKVVQKICGHASSKMTESIYADTLDETVVDAMVEFEEKLTKN